MAKFGEISWKAKKTNGKTIGEVVQDREALHASFLNFFRKEYPNQEIIEFSHIFEKEYERLEKAIFASKAIFKKIPLLSTFLEWVQKAHSEKKEEIEDAKLLLKYGFIGIKDSEGNPWTLNHASLQDPNEIYSAIRCRRDLTLVERERLVVAYREFISYLTFRTDGYIPHSWGDNDKSFLKNRQLSPMEFAKFADQLNDNLQVIAKLLYYGGDRTLDEVLNLTISQIDFQEYSISYSEMKATPYPIHVFADIQALIGKRSKGKVFVGRQNTSLSPTTIFRNFKTAGINAGMPWLTLPSQLSEKTDSVKYL